MHSPHLYIDNCKIAAKNLNNSCASDIFLFSIDCKINRNQANMSAINYLQEPHIAANWNKNPNT